MQALEAWQLREIPVDGIPSPKETDFSDSASVLRSNRSYEALECLVIISPPITVCRGAFTTRMEYVFAIVDRSHFKVKLPACEGDCELGTLPSLVNFLAKFYGLGGSETGVLQFAITQLIADSYLASLNNDIPPDVIADLRREFE